MQIRPRKVIGKIPKKVNEFFTVRCLTQADANAILNGSFLSTKKGKEGISLRLKISAVILLFVALIFLFAACKKQGITIVDDQGKTRILATDEKGETMTDDAGNIIIMATGLDGENETQRIAMPDFYVSGKTVNTPDYSLTLPRGWTQSGGANTLRLKNKKGDVELTLVTMEGKTIEHALASAEQVVELMEREGGTAETAEATVCGEEATLFTVVKGDEGRIVFRIFEKNGTVFSFYSVTTGKDTDVAEADKIIESIIFK